MSESNDLTYSRRGDYLLPNLLLEEQMAPETESQPLGMFGRMRRKYLKDHREITYNSLLLEGKLHSHLLEIDRTATDRMAQMMADLERKNPPPDKTRDQMAWTQHMNSLRQQAQEIILNDLIYNS